MILISERTVNQHIRTYFCIHNFIYIRYQLVLDERGARIKSLNQSSSTHIISSKYFILKN